MDICSVHKCRQNELTYVNQLRKLTKQQKKLSKAEERKFNKELNKLKKKRKKQVAAVNRAVKKMCPQDKRKFRVFRTPSEIIIARKWSLSTSGECDFVFEPPKRAIPLETQTPCVGLDKLLQEERDNHEWNVAFQKALVKRLEASERRLTLDDYLDDDDDVPKRTSRESSRGSSRRSTRKKPAKQEAKVSTVQVPVTSEAVTASLPPAQEVFPEIKCKCARKIKREERRRKRFVKILEKEQERFALKTLKAQHKYERARMKAFKKCENSQLAIEKGFLKGPRDGPGGKTEETFSVFIHMDPGECGCRGRAACIAKFKKFFFACCVWLYLFGFIIFFIVSFTLVKI